MIKNIIRDEYKNIIAINDDGSTYRITPEELRDINTAQANEIRDKIAQEFERDTEAARNRERCKNIADELDDYAAGNVYRCPHCGEAISLQDEHENEDGDTVYKCPMCGEDFEETDAEQLSIYDYLDEVYDVKYTIDDRGDYCGACIMVACGGPNIWIDTDAGAVVLRWWGDRAQYPLSSEAVEIVDDWARECWEGLRYGR